MSTPRRIAIVRHAKSDWEAGIASDHERPLNDRGRREAPELARRLVGLGWAPRIVLSSDSTRTRETWAYMAKELPAPARLEWLPALYHAGRDQALEALGTIADDELSEGGRGVVLLLGHNPGWEELVTEVTGVVTTMKTATAALLSGVGTSYQAALRGRLGLEALIFPR